MYESTQSHGCTLKLQVILLYEAQEGLYLFLLVGHNPALRKMLLDL